ncbi:HAMP domain-containing sensor histidine kinase [Clavibacter michiganensis]|uniref:HAMP domain-containing sensor histidine kinase n=1 Tax=Clavibacter michiganensis TaxID=28447 RepID=UPI0027DDD9C7|nr:HAMP domain-containing sensor histidine kinase [Clavibacter michiganensis]
MTTPAEPSRVAPAASASARAASLRSRLVAAARGMTLRRRLVLSVVGLLALASILIGAVSILALRASLVQQVDQQLQATAARSESYVDRDPGGYGSFPGAPPGGLGAFGQQVGTISATIIDGVVSGGYIADRSAAAGEPGGAGAVELTERQSQQLQSVPTDGVPRTVDLGGALGSYRLVGGTSSSGATIVTGLPTKPADDVVEQLVLVITVVAALTLALAALLGTAIVRRALRPLDRVVDTATHVAALELDRGDVALEARVPASDTDERTEVGRVGAALNGLLGHVADALSSRQASEAKVRRFVSDASHELRTPLASIRGYAELTRRGPHALPEDVTHSLSRIESESVRMTTIVEDLLLLARLDEGRELESDPVDVTRILLDTVGDASAAGPDHDWDLELPEDSVSVPGDDARLRQVVVNLLANARTHTPAGTRVVASLAVEGAGSDGHAVIRVTDDGPGIPPELQASLFERFVRGDGSRARSTGGTGLGLAIAQAIVAAHDGAVWVESEPGRTVFGVRLPLGRRAAEARATADAPVGAGSDHWAPPSGAPVADRPGPHVAG